MNECRKRPDAADLDKLIFIVGWWHMRMVISYLHGAWRWIPDPPSPHHDAVDH